MVKFLKTTELQAAIAKLFTDAQTQLILISPYIQFHPHLKEELKRKHDHDKLKITVIFGKNKEDLHKSLNQEDLNFLMGFPNVEIRYEERLHAKYYANDLSAILTSMNLYTYSQNNNIEAGILMESTLLGDIIHRGESLDNIAYLEFEEVIKQSVLLFKNEPQYEKTRLRLSKNYIGMKNTINILDKYFIDKPVKAKVYTKTEETKKGFCIRTGKEISFNLKKPYTDLSFKSWSKYKNEKFIENYCHFSGKKSNGETCFAKPILSEYWHEAMKQHSTK
jgi:hypothetical protein